MPSKVAHPHFNDNDHDNDYDDDISRERVGFTIGSRQVDDRRNTDTGVFIFINVVINVVITVVINVVIIMIIMIKNVKKTIFFKPTFNRHDYHDHHHYYHSFS